MKPIYLGETQNQESVTIESEYLAKHMHIIGASGLGKSKFLELLIRHNLHNQSQGACVIDPHGLLIKDILHYVSHVKPHLARRIVVFNPAEQSDQIIGFNPIPNDDSTVEFKANQLVDTIMQAWKQDDPSEHPRIRRWLYNIFHPIVAQNLTLVEAVALINIHAKEHRKALLQDIEDPEVSGDWTLFEKSQHLQKQNIIEGAANRLHRLLRTEEIRFIFGQQNNVLDFADIMENKKILLVNLNGKNKINSEDCSLIGVMLLNEIFRVGMLREDQNPRTPVFNLYIDEFGQYVTKSVAKMLDEIRKKKIYLRLAHQHLGQLAPKSNDRMLLKSIKTNCRTKVVFGGLDEEDAKAMTDLVWTGNLNLHEIHSELETTKVRTIEEIRTSINRGKNQNTSKSHMEGGGSSDGYSESDALSRSDGHTVGQSTTDSDGVTIAHGSAVSDAITNGGSNTQSWGDTHSKSHTDGKALGKTSAKQSGTSQQNTTSNSTTETVGSGKSASTSSSRSNSSSSSNSSSRGETSGGSTSTQYRNIDGTSVYSSGNGSNYSSTENESKSSSNSESSSFSESQTKNSFRSRSKQIGSSKSHGSNESVNKAISTTLNQSDTVGNATQKGGAYARSQSRARTNTKNSSRAESHTHSKSKSKSKTHTDGQTHTDSKSHTDTKNYADTVGEIVGASYSETVGPYDRKEEYQEVTSRKYYSIPEQLHRKAGEMMNLDVGEMIIKISDQLPLKIQTEYVASPRWLGKTSKREMGRLDQKILRYNGSYYTPRLEALKEMEKRQIKAFGEPLRFSSTDNSYDQESEDSPKLLTKSESVFNI